MAKRYFETNGGGGGEGGGGGGGAADDGVSRDSVAESMAVGGGGGGGGVADGKQPSSVTTTAAAAASGGVPGGFQGDGVGPWRWDTSTFSPNLADMSLLMKTPDLLASDPQLKASLSSLQRHYQTQRELLAQQFKSQQTRLEHEEQTLLQQYMRIAAQHQQSVREWAESEQRKKEHADLERQNEKLEQIKNKKKAEESAIASTEVKMKLRECLLNKGHHSAANNHLPVMNSKFWANQHSSLEQQGSPNGTSPPLRPFIPPYMDAYPLRKTASEPNLKMRSSKRLWRHQVVQPLNSPLLTHGEKRRRKHLFSMSSIGSNPESRPESPPVAPGFCDSLTQILYQRDEPPTNYPIRFPTKSLVNQSMPNVAIGPLPLPAVSDIALKMDDATNPALTAMDARLRSLVVAHPHGDVPPSVGSNGNVAYDAHLHNPSLVESQRALELARRTGRLPYNRCADIYPYLPVGSVASLSDAHYRLCRPAMSRTLSEPIPLPGHPLWPKQPLSAKDNPSQFLKQKLLQISGSKVHMENVDEIAESHLQQDSKDFSERMEDSTELIISDTEDNDHSANCRSTDFQSVGNSSCFPRHNNNLNSDVRLSSRELLIQMKDKIGGQALTAKLMTSPESFGSRVFTTGLSYDVTMLKHQCLCGSNSVHPENGSRLQSIWARFQEAGLVSRCQKVVSRKATLEELQTCHSEPYVHMYASGPGRDDPEVFEAFISRFCKLPCGGIGVDSDTVWNESHTPLAARMATGSVIELALSVARGETRNGFAIVRPPGHHAEDTQAMGFCYFNSIAVAAKLLLSHLRLTKILIVDWDVHHGNSTQQLFYTDPRVLYISLHRHDSGHFFPGTGAPDDFGIDRGLGFNVNVAWGGSLNPPMGDAEYMAAFRTVVMPIAKEFHPEIVLVSAGFDAAIGHPAPLGGYQLSPECFGQMTKQLMSLASGRVVLVLEGGYDPQSTSMSAELCLRALLNDEIPSICHQERRRRPCTAALETLQTTIHYQGTFWKCLTRLSSTIGWSMVEAEAKEQEEVETFSAFASLSVLPMQPPEHIGISSQNLSSSNEPVMETYM